MEMHTRGKHLGELDYDALNWVALDCLERDRQQSRRLHEPAFLIGTIDPITGRDIDGTPGHPSIVSGNMTMYFESETTRQAYLDTPSARALNLPDNPVDEWAAEG